MDTPVYHSFQLLNCDRILITFSVRNMHWITRNSHNILTGEREGKAKSHGCVITIAALYSVFSGVSYWST
jgi:hypothetical protein